MLENILGLLDIAPDPLGPIGNTGLWNIIGIVAVVVIGCVVALLKKKK
ncbi:MAG: hypothetical protein J5694_03770 [Erysipelotrichaceae bacterium]|nr:hypothetical protein [Erysipelotrichaceae bacterium]